LGGRSRIPSSTSQTTRDLIQLKELLFRQGVCRYDDMISIGHWYAQKHECIVRALAKRFLCVLIDETQDTDSRQDAIVELVFGGRSVVQRFGDDRQAIYRGAVPDEAGTAFPRDNHLSMTSSKRISPSIARLAENVCNGDVEAMQGNNDVTDHAHTVFLVAPDRMTRVIPAFAHHVAAELGTDLTWREVKAIGFRREGDSIPERVPGILADYCHPEVTLARHASMVLASLGEYISLALTDVRSSGGTQQASDRLLLAVCRILDLQGLQHDGRAYSSRRLLRVLRDNDHQYSPNCLRVFSRLLSGGLADWNDGMPGFSSDLLSSLGSIHSDEWNQQVQDFCATAGDGGEAEEPAQDGGAVNPGGIIKVPTPQGDIELEIATIHSVKGETLEAVLVLTTFSYEHDLKKVIEAGFLRGVRPTAARSRQKRLQEHVKRIHVAMTRPRRLVCLAICHDHISVEHKTEMEALGWSFQDV